VQSYLQAIARKVYSRVPLPDRLAGLVRPIWDELPERDAIPESGHRSWST
jgi:hypothetical protein